MPVKEILKTLFVAAFGIPACLDRPTPHPRLESDYIIIQPFYSIIVLSKSPKPVYWKDLLQTLFIASLGILGLYACMRAFLFLTTLYP